MPEVMLVGFAGVSFLAGWVALRQQAMADEFVYATVKHVRGRCTVRPNKELKLTKRGKLRSFAA